MKESDMFEPLKNFLQKQGFDRVYGEVGSADVVGINKQGEEVVVEMKKTLNFKVLEQAFERFGRAKYIYIAVPLANRSKAYNVNHRFAYYILREYGVGLLYVPIDLITGENSYENVYEFIESAEHHVERSIADSIRPYNELTVGGSKSGDTITDYGYTMMAVKAFMQKYGDWLTVDEILKHVETHWARPKPSLAADLRMSQNTNWCEFKKVGRENVYRYIEGAEENGREEIRTLESATISEKVDSKPNSKKELHELFSQPNKSLKKEKASS
ncbi:hypothetical protein ABD91_26085 [Lysinibacillus sphaericus]|uniref:hypothetical protein n=1 Tax=Lysinibacillus sphaericus TaxID=1421 RepID=UPI0018CCFB2C|nr:hypothetical protein [Lysinibacillus sphaericus]MBG9694203.1 hypothetical protein [Lysinibacillus sphaericus]